MTMHIQEIPDARTLGISSNPYTYYREKGAEYIAGLSWVPFSPSTVEYLAKQSLLEVQQAYPPSTLTADLVEAFKEAAGQNYLSRNNLGKTALTALLANEYGIDMTEAIGDPEDPQLYIAGSLPPRLAEDVITLDYGTDNESSRGSFLQLRIDRQYPFINAYCVGPLSSTMLRGEADIANIKGVAEALLEDVRSFGAPAAKLG